MIDWPGFIVWLEQHCVFLRTFDYLNLFQCPEESAEAGSKWLSGEGGELQFFCLQCLVEGLLAKVCREGLEKTSIPLPKLGTERLSVFLEALDVT